MSDADRIPLPGGYWLEPSGRTSDVGRDFKLCHKRVTFGIDASFTERQAQAFAEAMNGPPGPKLFPIMGAPYIPWSLIEPYEFQAEKNHGQSLKRLAERGGLDITEAMAVMMAKPYRDIWRPTLDQFTAFIRAREIEQAKHLAELAAISQAAAHEAITDAAVEAAMLAWCESWGDEPPSQGERNHMLDSTRQALEAGLAAMARPTAAGSKPTIHDLEILLQADGPPVRITPEGKVVAIGETETPATAALGLERVVTYRRLSEDTAKK